jgi:DNA-directed RNA polymerase sigma subunit (sigma70/sigma32)
MHLPVVRESCALEAAELGGMTLEEIASRLSITRERVRQIELGALTKLWLRLGGNQDGATASTGGMRRNSRIAA